jgi:hypothetical protein
VCVVDRLADDNVHCAGSAQVRLSVALCAPCMLAAVACDTIGTLAVVADAAAAAAAGGGAAAAATGACYWQWCCC